MPLSPSAFLGSISAETLLRFAEAAGWTLDQSTLEESDPDRIGRAAQQQFNELPTDQKDHLYEVFEDAEAISKDPTGQATFDVVGEDEELREWLEAAASPRERALIVKIADLERGRSSRLFDRALALTELNTRSTLLAWSGYNLKHLPRDWELDQEQCGRIEEIAAQVIEEVEQRKRRVEVDFFARPSTRLGWEDALLHVCLISIEDRKTDVQAWKDGKLGNLSYRPNRQLVLAINPQARTCEIVPRYRLSSDTASAITNKIARNVLGELEDLKRQSFRHYTLAPLKERPAFRTHPEHGIGEVKVTKLVLAGPGSSTATFWARVSSNLDAYQVIESICAATSAESFLAGKSIIAAKLRVVFEAGGLSARRKVVSFEITRPHRCDLNEKSEFERQILTAYLPDWHLLSKGEDSREAPTRSPVQCVSQLLATPGLILPEEFLIESLGPSFESWKDEGLLVPSGNGDLTACPACLTLHELEHAYHPERHEWGVICDDHGWIPAKSQDHKDWQLDVKGYSQFLATRIGASELARRELREGVLYSLGVVEHERRWTAFLALGPLDAEHINQLAADLSGQVGKEPGLVICGGTLPKPVTLPNGHQFIAISNLLEHGTDDLSVNWMAVERALDGKPQARKRGPKTRAPEARDVLVSRKRHGLTKPDPDDECQAVIETLNARHPDWDGGSIKEMRYTWFKGLL